MAGPLLAPETFARYHNAMRNADNTGFSPARRPDRKTLQLCRQVQRALTFALAETGEEVLLDVQVESVDPQPGPGQMLVSVSGSGDAPEILAALHRNTGHLRNEVAAAITRRKAPELFFKVIRH
jgi:ribosome-binding factor A